jgi:acyl-CoA thioesterase FadM
VNLYLRLLGVLLRSWLLPPLDPLAVNRLPLWVKPWDCDLNFHMNNGRYLTIMDLGRLHLMGRAKLIGPLLRHGWSPLVAASDLHFSGALRPFERYVLETEIAGWDERWFYLEQRFVARGIVRARGWIKGAFFEGRAAVAPVEVLKLAGVAASSPALPAPMARWAELHTSRRPRES